MHSISHEACSLAPFDAFNITRGVLSGPIDAFNITFNIHLMSHEACSLAPFDAFNVTGGSMLSAER